MKRSKKLVRWSIILFLLLAAVGGGYYWATSNGDDAPVVRTARVERGGFEVTAQSSGTVEADLTVEVKSRASGEVIELKVDAGDVVKAGDLLVRLDPVDEDRNVEGAQASAIAAEARVAQSRASLAAARADRDDSLNRLARRRSAYANGLVSVEELQSAVTTADVATRSVEQREAELRSSTADYSRARLAIDEARRRREETVIKAPVDGTVLAVNVDRGAIIASGISNVGGGTSLLTLADLSRLLVTVKLDEAQIGAVRKGLEARIRVDAHPDIVFRGEVERVSPLGVTEANIVTFDVRVLVNDRRAHLLRPGMSTDVEIVTDRLENVLLVPSSALRRLPGRGGGRPAGRETPAGAQGDGRPPQDGRETRGDTTAAGWRQRTDTAPREDQPPRRSPRSRAVIEFAGGDTRVVVTGPSNGSMTVIEDGLAEGDEIVVGSGASRAPASGAARTGSSPFTPTRRR